MKKVPFYSFYNEYHGHKKQDLELLHKNLCAVKAEAIRNNTHSFVFLVGDSSCDNKYWLNGAQEKACNGYEHVLDRPKAVPDIAHCLNQLAQQQQQNNNNNKSEDAATSTNFQHTYTIINCAVEESTIGLREDGKLLPQDEFVRDHVTENDIIVSSLLGNDIALRPTVSTIAAVGWLAKCSSTKNIQDGSAWGLGHFHNLAHDCYEAYLKNLTIKRKPKMIVPAMIYHLDENPKSESWANKTLELIGYNTNPSHVQAIIHRVFLDCFKNDPLKVPGVKHIFPIELSKALDGKDPKDYDNRVEPSVQGGRKMAAYIWKNVLEQVQRLDSGEVDVCQKSLSEDAALESDDDDSNKKKKSKCLKKSK